MVPESALDELPFSLFVGAHIGREPRHELLTDRLEQRSRPRAVLQAREGRPLEPPARDQPPRQLAGQRRFPLAPLTPEHDEAALPFSDRLEQEPLGGQ